MPGIYTHYLAADAAYNKLSDGPLKEFIKKYKHIYDLGAQGPDVFYYFRPLSKYREDVTRYSNMLHERQVDHALRTMVNYMMDALGEDKNILTAYLMGYICHYSIDSSCYPFIYYRAGFITQGRGDAKKFKSYYNRLRNELDYLITQRITGKKPSELSMTPHVEVDYEELDEFCRMYPVVLKKVYGKNSSRDYVIKAYQNFYEFSKIHFKNRFYSKLYYRVVEFIKKNKGEFTQLFYPKAIKDLDQLNENRKEWFLPWENRITRKDTYMELFEQGVNKAVPMIEAIYQAYLGNGSDISVIEVTGANSMITGVKWNSPMVWKFYDLIYEPGVKSFD